MDQVKDKRPPRSHCFSDVRFDFAFNDPVFSDRTLKLMVFDDSPDDNEEKEDGGSSASASASDSDSDSASASDSGSASGSGSGSGTDSCESLKRMKRDIPQLEEGYEVKKVPISTVILAARSSFFRKMFTNGMKECEQGEIALRIYSSEEAALMDTLKFMYSNTLSAKSPVALLKVLMTADKFVVPSCVSYCCTLLLSDAMNLEMAFLFVDIPSSIVSNNVDVRGLVTVAEDFIFTHLDDVQMYRGNIMNLSLDGIKVLLPSDRFKVDSEDTAYDLFLEWAEAHFPDSEQRSKVFYSELCNIIRLDHMTKEKLKHILTVLLDSNSLTVDRAVRTSILNAIVYNKSNYGFECCPSGRAYKLSSFAVTVFKHPELQCSVFWNLTRKECQSLGFQNSEAFVLGCNVIYVSVKSNQGHKAGRLTFHLRLKESTKRSVKMHIEYAVRKEAHYGTKFEEHKKAIMWTFIKENEERYNHMYQMVAYPAIRDCACGSPYYCRSSRCGYNYGHNNTTSFVSEPCFFIDSNFINDIMYLRFDVTLVSEE